MRSWSAPCPVYPSRSLMKRLWPSVQVFRTRRLPRQMEPGPAPAEVAQPRERTLMERSPQRPVSQRKPAVPKWTRTQAPARELRRAAERQGPRTARVQVPEPMQRPAAATKLQIPSAQAEEHLPQVRARAQPEAVAEGYWFPVRHEPLKLARETAPLRKLRALRASPSARSRPPENFRPPAMAVELVAKRTCRLRQAPEARMR